MNYKFPLASIILAVGGAMAVLGAGSGNAAAAKSDTGFAVVELFTSEGCSSCPSADAALAELIKTSKGKRVYALAFHVDYWDHLGWADPYGSPAYSARQSAYAQAFKLSSIYTPQAVVNGSEEFVGSDRGKLKSATDHALATKSDATLSGVATVDDNTFQVDISSAGLQAGVVVSVAVVEDGLISSVARGENGGRKLPHEHVVRAFRSIAIGDDGKASLTLSPAAGVKLDRCSVIVYAQRPTNMQVLAATELSVGKK